VSFAFGAPWFGLIEQLWLVEVDWLGSGGRPYGSGVPTRSVVVATTLEGRCWSWRSIRVQPAPHRETSASPQGGIERRVRMILV
jgi:hypothetical protein